MRNIADAIFFSIFQDFVIGLSKLIRGSILDKLKWTFDMYDVNQDGVITKDELTQIVAAVYELMGKSVETVLEDENQVDKVFMVSSSY